MNPSALVCAEVQFLNTVLRGDFLRALQSLSTPNPEIRSAGQLCENPTLQRSTVHTRPKISAVPTKPLGIPPTNLSITQHRTSNRSVQSGQEA